MKYTFTVVVDTPAALDTYEVATDLEECVISKLIDVYEDADPNVDVTTDVG
ncbi:hypothetical protein [Trebonia kvetii]|uniref:hypothetical protein n=1 Tax=Trebonia kvetii TaxID=2480626 RepID=UPI0016529D04|nr:hypothetical protein [Trebonia kvetii]